MKLTPHFHLDEFLISQTATRAGIEFPEPSKEIIDNLTRLCKEVLEPLRRAVDRPVIVTSGWRPPEVNRLVGGSPRSQHLTGQAADIIVPGVSVFAVATLLRHYNRHFDQLIDEFGRWTHVSVPAADYEPRRQVLSARRRNGKTVYLQGWA
jgi:zinc D-Ala-D-Ala carboxypeptidase